MVEYEKRFSETRFKQQSQIIANRDINKIIANRGINKT